MPEDRECSGNCESCTHKDRENGEDCRIRRTLENIKHPIVVMSGKGGVGKSTVAVNLAFALALEGRRVGLLDADVHGPSVPRMLGLDNVRPGSEDDMLLPAEIGGLKVVSVGLLLENRDDAVIWRGPMKIGVIRQLLSEVKWGELDDLVVDCPPGTGDEPLTVCQLLSGKGKAVIVTTPQQVAAEDVAKSINFCSQLSFPVLGIVENMSGFVCPKCGETVEIFAHGAGEELSRRYDIPLLAKIPVEPAVCAGGDAGAPFIRQAAGTPAGKAFAEAVEKIIAAEEE